METSPLYPSTMRAAIDPAAIRKVNRFFNATLDQIIDELFQNARRSGATQVSVTTTTDRMRISDDGSGMSDPGTVLSFGGSSWLNESVVTEDPAGMGVFSLARRNCRIESRPKGQQGWSVQLTPAHFLGQEPATIETGPDHQHTAHFTTVDFAIDETATQAAWTVRKCAKHFPLPVTLNGRTVDREPFLKDARFIEHWNNVQIGVYTHEPYEHYTRAINFHGQIVPCNKLPRLRTREKRHQTQKDWIVQVQIDSCPGLELVLPTRREVVQNDALNELVDACKAAIYKAMTKEAVEDAPYEFCEDAKRLGVTLPQATPQLQLWTPRNADSNDELDLHDTKPSTAPEVRIDPNAGEPMLMGARLAPIDQQVLHHALKLAGLDTQVFEPQHEYIGYEWYNNLTNLEGIQICWRNGRAVEHLDDVRRGCALPKVGKPEQIELVLKLNPPSGLVTERRLPLDVVCIPDSAIAAEEIEVLLPPDTSITTEMLTEMLVDGYFRRSNDEESDSLSLQHANFERDAQEVATGLTRSWPEARLEKLQNLAQTYLRYHVQKHETIHFTITGDGDVDVDVRNMEAEDRPQA